MTYTRRAALKATTALFACLTLSPLAFAADNIAADIQQPLWYTAPSAKTLELAKIDDLSNTVVSDGQRGEVGVLGSSITITDEQAAKIKAGNFTVGLSMGWLGDDWASEQLIGLKETFEKYGVKVVAETNANWDDAKQIADLETIAVLKPSLVVSIPLNGKTTASAFKALKDGGQRSCSSTKPLKAWIRAKTTCQSCRQTISHSACILPTNLQPQLAARAKLQPCILPTTST